MTTTLILCSTGSANHVGRSGLASLLNAVRRDLPTWDVIDAFIDTQQPTIDDVVRDGSGPRIVVPLTLTYDHRLDEQLSGIDLAAARVTLTAPVGPDWALAELGVHRLIEAGARPGDEIVLAAGAIRSERSLVDLGKAARLLSAVWGGRVHVGTLTGLGSPIAEAIDVARAYGSRVVVSIYSLAMTEAVGEIGRLGADVVTAPLLSGTPPDPGLVRLVCSRATSRGSWLEVGSDPFSA